MGRILDALMALGCFALISALWLAALGLLTTVLAQTLYGFNLLSLPAWKALYAAFLQGGTVPLGFIFCSAAAVLLAGAGEIGILWRLPAIVAAMPSPHLPRLSLPRLAAPKRRQQPPRIRAEPVMRHASSAPPPPPPAPPPPPIAEVSSKKIPDSAILSRILALFDVWNEPPPAWMAEALRDEVVLLSPDAWPTLESLGGQGLDLLIALREHDMLPESPAALRAIGEVETILRAGISASLDAAGAVSAPPPVLTLAASWLCEALENILAAQADPLVSPDRLSMARGMFDRALRGMADADWASLDRFPEKAGRVRVLSDQLREDLRAASSRPVPPADPAEAVIALLKQFGFSLEAGGSAFAETPVLAQREDFLLLLQTVDLRERTWRLPKGLLGPWSPDDSHPETMPARLLWQQVARRRLRQTDHRPVSGLLVVHGGHIEQEDRLADLVAADRRRSGVGLAWLAGGSGLLPSLERELAELPERTRMDRRRDRAAGLSASPP